MRFLVLLIMLLGSVIGKAQDSVIIGNLSISDLKNVSGWEDFALRYDQYQVQKAPLTEVRPFLSEVKIIYLFIGTWCSDSQEQIPGAWRVLSELGLISKCSLIGVNREKNEPLDWVNTYSVKVLPSIILVLENGKEMLVMEETPKINFESDLLNMLLTNK